MKKLLTTGLVVLSTLMPLAPIAMAQQVNVIENISQAAPHYQTAKVQGLNIFYREAGDSKKPAIVLLHGFPSSSHMFRNLIPELSKDYHVIAPDYPGFGNSDMPSRDKFTYSFDNYAKIVAELLAQKKVDKYALYVFDYGAPVGFRLFQDNPEKVTAIISQNGNAYQEGIDAFWDPIRSYWKTGGQTEREALRWLTSVKATKWQYENGVPESHQALISPDGWQHDQSMLDRPDNAEIQLDLFYDYRTNLPLYQKWQKTLRTHKPPVLAVWGKNDAIFVHPGATAFKRDVPNAEIHLLDTGHFALETHAEEIGNLIQDFLKRSVK